MSDNELKERLRAIAHRLRAATPGPWAWMHEDDSLLILANEHDLFSGHVLACSPCEACRARKGRCVGPSDANMEFLQHAPSDIGFLLNQLRLLGEASR